MWAFSFLQRKVVSSLLVVRKSQIAGAVAVSNGASRGHFPFPCFDYPSPPSSDERPVDERYLMRAERKRRRKLARQARVLNVGRYVNIHALRRHCRCWVFLALLGGLPLSGGACVCMACKSVFFFSCHRRFGCRIGSMFCRFGARHGGAVPGTCFTVDDAR